MKLLIHPVEHAFSFLFYADAASGGSDDWAKAKAGIKYSYVVELRDTGANYFMLPPTEIIPSGQETLEALKVIANFVKNTYSN